MCIRDRINVEKQKVILDTFNKERDRQVKMHDIDTKLKVAKPDKSLMKPKPFDSLKNSIRPLRMTGSSLSFLGVDMTISSSFISSLGRCV